MSASPGNFNSGYACVKAPTLAGPWTAFQCQSCYQGSCVQAPKCSLSPKKRRSLLAPGCQTGVSCNLGDSLDSSTPYT